MRWPSQPIALKYRYYEKNLPYFGYYDWSVEFVSRASNWSSTIGKIGDSYWDYYASCHNLGLCGNNEYRYCGFTVRPVTE